VRNLLVFFALLLSQTLWAAPLPAEPVASPAKKIDKKAQKEMNFEDLLVQGKYHFSDEAVTTVEEDKVLDGLIGVRTDFKDRLRKSSTRQ